MFLPSLYAFSSWGILALRIALAAIFFVHGPPKLAKSESMAAGMGLPAGFVWLLGLVETLSALSVLLGLLTQLGALGITVVMLGALHYKINKWHMPFTAMDKTGWEFDLVLLGAALTLLTIGPGMLSLDWLVLGLY